MEGMVDEGKIYWILGVLTHMSCQEDINDDILSNSVKTCPIGLKIGSDGGNGRWRQNILDIRDIRGIDAYVMPGGIPCSRSSEVERGGLEATGDIFGFIPR